MKFKIIYKNTIYSFYGNNNNNSAKSHTSTNTSAPNNLLKTGDPTKLMILVDQQGDTSVCSNKQRNSVSATVFTLFRGRQHTTLHIQVELQ